MKKALKVPATLAFVVVGGAAIVAPLMTSCGGESPPIDAANTCELFCIPDGTDAGTGMCDSCADAGACPAGCTPVG